MRVLIRPVGELSADDRRELGDLGVRCFGPPDQRPPHPLTIQPDDDLKYVVRVWTSDGLLVSCMYLAERSMLIAGRLTRVGCIRGVHTDPAHRRRGYGRELMQQAEAFAWRELKPALLMLHSSVMAVPFYESLGWRAIEGPVYCAQPAGALNVTEHLPRNPIMVVMPPGQPLPRGLVDICGLPF